MVHHGVEAKGWGCELFNFLNTKHNSLSIIDSLCTLSFREFPESPVIFESYTGNYLRPTTENENFIFALEIGRILPFNFSRR